MRLRVWSLFLGVLAGLSSEPAHAQLTLTVEPNPVFGGTRTTVTATAVLSAPHPNGAIIGFFGFCGHPAVPLAPAETTARVEVMAPPLVSVQTTFQCAAIASYDGQNPGAQAFFTVDPVELRIDLTQSQIVSGTRQVIGSVSISPPAVAPVLVSYGGGGLLGGQVTILPGESAPIEVVAPVVSESRDVELKAEFFTLTGFLTATRTVTVVPSQPLARSFLEGSIVGSFGSTTSVELEQGRIPVVQVPLGGQMRLSLLRAVGDQVPEPVQSSFFLSEEVELDAANDLAPRALFPAKVVLEYNRGQATTQKFFQAVHRGTIVLTVVPNDSEIPPVQVQVKVYQPTHLAGDNHDFDEAIFKLAHRHGILPQFYKAHFAREGEFAATAWRYEPLNLETGDLNISRGDNLRAAEDEDRPYGFYRLPNIGDRYTVINFEPCPDPDLRIPDPDCPGLEEGTGFLPEDMNAVVGIEKFKIQIPERDAETGELIIDEETGLPKVRLLGADDRYVSARDIYRFNDAVYHWSRYVKSTVLASRLGQLDFTAQLTLAASYGLMQIMYVTAIQEGWTGTPDGQNPSFLLDTPENLLAGGGSIEPGSGFLTRRYRKLNRGVTAFSPNFADYAALQKTFQRTYQSYNDGMVGYGHDVIIIRSPGYLPIPDRAVVQIGDQQ